MVIKNEYNHTTNNNFIHTNVDSWWKKRIGFFFKCSVKLHTLVFDGNFYFNWSTSFMDNYLKAKAKEPASDWAKPFIDTAIDVGAMTDVGGTIERPKSWMTREELSVVVAALARKG